MLVEVREMPDNSVLQNLRDKLLQDLKLTKEEFPLDGVLPIMPAKTGNWLNVNLWKNYYGLGYERGNIILFIRCAEWLEENLPDCKVFYGREDENVKLFDSVERKKYLTYFEKVGNEPYTSGDLKRRKQLRAMWGEE